MKLFKSSNVELIKECQNNFRCVLPSLSVDERCQTFISKYDTSVRLIHFANTIGFCDCV